MVTVEKDNKAEEKPAPVVPENVLARRNLLDAISSTYNDHDRVAMGPVHTLIGQPFHYLDDDLGIPPEVKSAQNDILVEALTLVLAIRNSEKSESDWWEYFDAHETEDRYRFLMIDKYRGTDLQAIGMFQVLLHPTINAKHVVLDASIHATITERSKKDKG